MKRKDTVYRLVPCPCYEVEACESWLTDMAAHGLFVEYLGRTFARFHRGVPHANRYRLTAARLKGGWLDLTPTEPPAEERALYAASGWQFVCAQGEFFLYACPDPQSPELHTDPAVQALSLKMARRSAWSAFLGAIVVLAVQFALNGQGRLVRLLVEMPVLSLCLYLYFFSALLLAFRDLYHILTLSRRLRRGYAPDHRKNWHPAARANRLLQGISSGTFCLLLVLCFAVLVQAVSDSSRTDYHGVLPFATLADLADGTVIPDGDASTVEMRHSLLAPTIMEYTESGRVVRDGETVLDGSLRVNYYETRAPWLARLLTGDLHEQRETLVPSPQPLPDLLGVDAAWAYRDETGVFREVILVQGGRVMSALWTDPYSTADFDALATRMAEAFAAQ